MPTFKASRPSNIALVKYRGKKPNQQQIPQNPSVSLSLTHCRTHMTLKATKKEKKSDPFHVNLIFEWQENHRFWDKISRYLTSLQSELPFLINYNIEIESHNTFPHSSGIASSASAFATIADLLFQRKNSFSSKERAGVRWVEYMSDLARRGSWSASRSIYPWLVTRWVESNIYASPVSPSHIHESLATIYDTVAIVSQKEKLTSSRAGHTLMETNPYASVRYDQARHHTSLILQSMKVWDRSSRGHIVEQEALELHAMMFISNPHTILRQPETLRLIHLIRDYRDQTWKHVYYTIDAGCNVHILSQNKLSDNFKNEIWCELLEDESNLLLSL